MNRDALRVAVIVGGVAIAWYLTRAPASAPPVAMRLINYKPSSLWLAPNIATDPAKTPRI